MSPLPVEMRTVFAEKTMRGSPTGIVVVMTFAVSVMSRTTILPVPAESVWLKAAMSSGRTRLLLVLSGGLPAMNASGVPLGASILR